MFEHGVFVTNSGKISPFSRLNTDDDLNILREVAAAKLRIPPNGKKPEQSENSTFQGNASKFTHDLNTWKSVQDYYYRLQEYTKNHEKVKSRIKSVGGEADEVKELRSHIKNARLEVAEEEDKKRQKTVDKSSLSERLAQLLCEKRHNDGILRER